VTTWDRPLYLYFLDRELGRLLKNAIGPDTTERVLKTLLLGTTSTFYCGLSLLWESPGLDPDLLPFISHLVRNGALDIVSHHRSAGEFLESRRVLYAHDIERYPMYFSKSSNDRARFEIEPTRHKDDSTTGALNEQLISWAVTQKGDSARSRYDSEALAAAKKSVGGVLIGRANQAITLSLFVQPTSRSSGNASLVAIIQSAISKLYVSHYMEFGNATIPTGIPRLEFFELELAAEFPLYDISLLSAILATLGLAPFLIRPWRACERTWSDLANWRGGYIHSEFRRGMRTLLQALCQSVKKSGANRSDYAVREAMLASLRRSPVRHKESTDLPWMDVLYRLDSLERALRKDSDFAESIEKIKEQSGDYFVDVLLVTVADVERDAVLEAFKIELGHEARLTFGRLKTYYEMGTLGGARITMVQSEMGSVSPGASLSTVAEACDALHPTAVIAVGIAFGVDSKKQTIGDVLVSKQMHAYELQRVGTQDNGDVAIIPRGATVDASPRLLDRFRSAAVGLTTAKVRFGLMLSGEKLIDNRDFRDELRSRYPQAIGGEMEAVGVYSAAFQRNTDWIVVKGVCDWADGKKRFRKQERQRLAANNATMLVIRAIKLGGLSGGTNTARSVET
jgi:nucleoside phosphorylase